jgi:hypothetical protein
MVDRARECDYTTGSVTRLIGGDGMAGRADLVCGCIDLFQGAVAHQATTCTTSFFTWGAREYT